MKRMTLVMGMMVVMAGGTMATPLNPAQVGADAKWVVHVDADQLRATSVGKLILQQLETGKCGDKMNAAAAIFGSDLRRDLAGATLYGSSGGESNAVVVVNGRFNAAQLITLLKANPEYQVEPYQDGIDIHSWVDKKNHRAYGAILPGNLIVLTGEKATIKRAVDVVGGRSVSLARENHNSVPLDAATGSTFFLASADMANLAAAKINAQILRQTHYASISIGEEGADVVGRIRLDADSKENAQQLNNVVMGIVALFMLNDKVDAQTKQALQSVESGVQDNTFKFTIRLPSQVVADGIRKAVAEKANKTEDGSVSAT